MIFLSFVVALVLAVWGVLSGSTVKSSVESIPDEWRVHYVKPPFWKGFRRDFGSAVVSFLGAVLSVKPLFFVVAVTVPAVFFLTVSAFTGSVVLVGASLGILLFAAVNHSSSVDVASQHRARETKHVEQVQADAVKGEARRQREEAVLQRNMKAQARYEGR